MEMLLLVPGIEKIQIEKNYDLFFDVAQFTKDLIHLESVKGWKDHCKISICWLNELWKSEIYKDRYFLKILSKFDYVIVHSSQSLEAIQEIIQKKCFYLPYGINAIFFCPYPDPLSRVVDVYSIGRRSNETHKTLLKMANNKQIFYIYDTIIGCEVNNPDEHRQLFANTAKRSRYFIVNPGRITRPDITQGQSEFGNRFFEGAASGTIMIGETPKNEEFANVFDWPDAIIHLPFGSSDIDNVIKALDKQPERKEKIRKNNIVQSLRRHDWVYRWESVLKIADLTPLPQLGERKQCLRELSNTVEKI